MVCNDRWGDFSLSVYGLIIFAGLLSFILTGILRRYALVHRLIDVPNERSSHVVPTPRGGGLAIVLAFLMVLPWLELSGAELWALFGSGAAVALVGFLDDHKNISASWRLFVHFIAAGWALACLGGLPPLLVPGFPLTTGWLGYFLAAIYLVWLLNLYNFMDGIDGIAGIEAITVCIGGMVLYFLIPAHGVEWQLLLLLLVTVIGFLFWNFPNAKIFMGDVGSGFIGMALGILSIQAAWVAPELFWGWVILLGAFIVDATITLIKRILHGERPHEAHRSHAYQFASRKYASHITVSLAFGIINLLWLLPISILVVREVLGGMWGIIIAYLPLVVMANRFKAGSKGSY